MENNQLLRDVLTGALIGIARAVDGNEHLISAATNQIVQEGLSALLHDPDGGSLSPPDPACKGGEEAVDSQLL